MTEWNDLTEQQRKDIVKSITDLGAALMEAIQPGISALDEFLKDAVEVLFPVFDAMQGIVDYVKEQASAHGMTYDEYLDYMRREIELRSDLEQLQSEMSFRRSLVEDRGIKNIQVQDSFEMGYIKLTNEAESDD